jgi:hypothetical protein
MRFSKVVAPGNGSKWASVFAGDPHLASTKRRAGVEPDRARTRWFLRQLRLEAGPAILPPVQPVRVAVS